MRRKSFSTMQCPMARTLERVGDWWSLLILRDAMMGIRRFDEFQKSLGISPNILSRRLKQLVENDILERRVSKTSPVRVDYVFTPLGRAFEPMILYLHAFGNRHFATEGPSVMVVNRKSGRASDIQIVDRTSGAVVTWPEFRVKPGPAAKEPMLTKLAQTNSLVERELEGQSERRVRRSRAR
jgi:DNA-binding HxlR family transcriptional regulator